MSMTEMIRDLRERTGAGMMDCKKALEESGQNVEKAIDYLRAKGLSKAAKKAGREATEGVVSSYIHAGGRVGVLVEVNCETDFAGRNEMFVAFARDVAMHIAAMNPLYVRAEEIPADAIARERDVATAKAKETGKPDAIIAKMVDSAVTTWTKEVCLLNQTFVKNPAQTVEQLTQELVGKIGENIQIRRFVRFELGEGLTKTETNFAAEVAAAAGQA